MPLFSFVDFRDCNEKLVVKSLWINGVHSATVLGRVRGNRKNIERTIFYSPNPRDIPDFSLPIRTRFDGTKRACYKGYVLRTFGKCIISNVCDCYRTEF